MTNENQVKAANLNYTLNAHEIVHTNQVYFLFFFFIFYANVVAVVGFCHWRERMLYISAERNDFNHGKSK